MKKILFILIFFIPLTGAYAQKSEQKAEAEKLKTELIEQMLETRRFVFNVETMYPRGGGSLTLGYDFDVQVKGNKITTYLPFVGTAHHVKFGPHNTAFNFTQPINNYELKEKRKGYRVKLDTYNDSDHIVFRFHIKTSGFATLTVASSERQSISYSGTINLTK